MCAECRIIQKLREQIACPFPCCLENSRTSTTNHLHQNKNFLAKRLCHELLLRSANTKHFRDSYNRSKYEMHTSLSMYKTWRHVDPATIATKKYVSSSKSHIETILPCYSNALFAQFILNTVMQYGTPRQACLQIYRLHIYISAVYLQFINLNH